MQPLNAAASPTTHVKRLFVLLCGYEILPKSVSTRDRGERFIMSEPICAYLLDTRDGWVLLDTGLNPDHVDDPAQRAALFTDKGMAPPVVRRAHRLEIQLETIGVQLSDIRHVVLSHLHYDHSGYLSRLSHARVSVQRREYEAALHCPDLGYIAADYTGADLAWDLKDGDWQAMPGLELLDTRGHTAGHQSALVTLPGSGAMLLPFDVGDLEENFTDEILPGFCVDEAAAMAAILRLKRLQRERSATMLLFHDPVAIQHMRLAPDWYN